MTSVKTTISLKKQLFEQAEVLAEEMGVARSQLFAMALEEFVQRRENKRLLEQINAAYAEPDPDDEIYLKGIRRLYREAVQDDEA